MAKTPKVKVKHSTAITGPDGQTHVVTQKQYDSGALLRAMTPQPFAGIPGPGPGAGLVGQGPGSAGPAVSPQAPDPYLQSQILGANRNIGLGDAESTWQQGQLQRSSGIDASGNVITQGQDFNPFSQAMQLQDSWHANQRGTTNSLAAQGQLYSGAMANAQGLVDKGYAQGFDQLKTGTLGGYHGIQAGRLGNYASNSLGTAGAGFDSVYKQVYGQ